MSSKRSWRCAHVLVVTDRLGQVRSGQVDRSQVRAGWAVPAQLRVCHPQTASVEQRLVRGQLRNPLEGAIEFGLNLVSFCSCLVQPSLCVS